MLNNKLNKFHLICLTYETRSHLHLSINHNNDWRGWHSKTENPKIASLHSLPFLPLVLVDKSMQSILSNSLVTVQVPWWIYRAIILIHDLLISWHRTITAFTKYNSQSGNHSLHLTSIYEQKAAIKNDSVQRISKPRYNFCFRFNIHIKLTNSSN